MRKIFLILALATYSIDAQELEIANPNLNPNNLQLNPSTTSETVNTPIYGTPANYKIGKNNDFIVQVKEGNASSTSPWENLFVYNTFVGNSTIYHASNINSSFVSFSFSGFVTIKVTSLNLNNINSVVIRPLSRRIMQSISGNSVTFTIRKSDNFSVEFNGNRHQNLHVFANKIIDTNQIPYNNILQPYTLDCVSTGGNNSDGVYIYDTNLNTVEGKKIRIRAGAILIVPYILADYWKKDNACIVALNNDEIYIEEGGVLKGGVVIEEGSFGVKVYGRGMIDLTNYQKNYDFDYPNGGNPYPAIQGITVRKATKIVIDGIVINDSQQKGIELIDSEYVSINNVKIFSRVLWGDGIHMTGSSNVNINNCFIRTNDDGVAIYASRHTPPSWEVPYENNSAENIYVENTSFYSDFAHPIEIGFHGNSNTLNYYEDPNPNPPIEGTYIYNVTFNNIDILEHDMYWWHDGAENNFFDGAMSINCGEGNRINTILFKDIRIEDFTNGRLFSVNVEEGNEVTPLTDGKSIENVNFQNITYNGFGETPSTIKGLECEKFVNGVHFNNFRINGNLIKSLNGLNSYTIGGVNGIETNNYAYNITFEEANRYITSVLDDNYLIQNLHTGEYLQKVQNSGAENHTIKTILNTTNNPSIFPDSQIWKFEYKPGSGHYYIRNYSDQEYLQNTSIQFIGEQFAPYQWPHYCDARFLNTDIFNSSTTQEWKIEKVPNSNNYKIHNAHTRAFLTQDIINYGIVQNYGIVRPEILSISEMPDLQKWIIKKLPNDAIISARENLNEANEISNILFFPNPCVDNIQIQIKLKAKYFVKITDLNGRIVYRNEILNETSKHNVSNISNGIYILNIENNGNTIFSEKFLKIK
jgi:hypothetical protein